MGKTFISPVAQYTILSWIVLFIQFVHKNIFYHILTTDNKNLQLL